MACGPKPMNYAKLNTLDTSVIEVELIICALKNAMAKGKFPLEDEVYLLNNLYSCKKVEFPSLENANGEVVNILGLSEMNVGITKQRNIPNLKEIVTEELSELTDYIFDLETVGKHCTKSKEFKKQVSPINQCNNIQKCLNELNHSIKNLIEDHKELQFVKIEESHIATIQMCENLNNEIIDISTEASKLNDEVNKKIYGEGCSEEELKTLKNNMEKELEEIAIMKATTSKELKLYESIYTKEYQEIMDNYNAVLKEIMKKEAAIAALQKS